MLSCVKCNRTDGWTLPVQSWLQAITATGVAQSIFWCLLMQMGKAIHPAPAWEGWRFGSGHLVAVGGHLDLMSLDLPLLQRSFSFSQRFLPHHGAAWVRCPLQSVCGLFCDSTQLESMSGGRKKGRERLKGASYATTNGPHQYSNFMFTEMNEIIVSVVDQCLLLCNFLWCLKHKRVTRRLIFVLLFLSVLEPGFCKILALLCFMVWL